MGKLKAIILSLNRQTDNFPYIYQFLLFLLSANL